MTPRKSTETVLRKVGLGFLVAIALIWIVEFFHIPHYLLGEPAVFYWPRVLLRTAIIGGIWLWMHLTIGRLLLRMRELEDMLRICSWCRKIGYQSRWVTLEDFFGAAFSTRTSHSICPACAASATAKIPTLPGEPVDDQRK